MLYKWCLQFCGDHGPELRNLGLFLLLLACDRIVDKPRGDLFQACGAGGEAIHHITLVPIHAVSVVVGSIVDLVVDGVPLVGTTS